LKFGQAAQNVVHRCIRHAAAAAAVTAPEPCGDLVEFASTVGSCSFCSEQMVTGQLADKPPRGQPSRGLVRQLTD